MFCPNCAAKNDKKQNFCRFCGLDLRDSAKSLTTQLVFGKDSDSLKKFRTVKRAVDIASGILVVAWIAGVVADVFFVMEFGRDLMRISIGLFVLFQLIQGAVGYFQRKERSHSESDGLEPNRAVQFETRDTAKLLNETPTIPASVTEHSTKLFPVENKARKLE